MTKRLTRLIPAMIVVIATTAWAQYVSAAIVLNSEGLQFGSGGMSAPVRPADAPSPRFDCDRWDTAVLEGFLSQGGAGA